MTVGIIKKRTVPTKRATVCWNNVKSWNALLRILPVCIHSCLKSVLRYKFLILHTVIRTLYLREEGYEGPWLFFEAVWGLRSKTFGKHWSRC